MGRLFGTTGVRKIYGSEFDIEMALNLGKSLGTHLGGGTVALAHDVRTTGRMVADAFSAGLLSTGTDVVRTGMLPTPTLAFVTMQHGYDAGAMITASHNPPEYTGVKFWSQNSMGYTPDEEEKVEELYYSRKFIAAPWDKLGTEQVVETAVSEHIEAILSRCDSSIIKKKEFKVIVDPGNGAACVLTPYLMRELGCKVITINGQPDGSFPGRISEPDEETLKDLARMMPETGADLGIAHDGDSDRVIFVTERGEVIRGDRTIALLARETLKTSSSKTIVTTVDSSRVLDETVQKAGGRTIRTPVGDIQVSIKVAETKAAMGGEACGVFILPEFHLAPEPFLAACRVLELMARAGESFGNLIRSIPLYPLLKTKLQCPNEMKSSVMKVLEQKVLGAFKDKVDIVTVDGLGVSLKEGWVLVRPSGTEPVIRITCEAPTNRQAETIMKRTKALVAEAIGRPSKPD
jgi:phosphoglucosamine mutase